MTTIKRKKIKVPGGAIERLAEDFKVSKTTVYNALSFRTCLVRADEIRDAARKKYKGIMTTNII
jgi:hypothetical protein